MSLIWDCITLQFIIDIILYKGVAILHPSVIGVVLTDNQHFALNTQSVTSNQQIP